MKKKVKNMLCAVIGFASMMQTSIAYASAANSLFELFIDIVGGIIIVIGVILAIVGLVSMALAYSDGDGPAKKKAGLEIASGIALCVLNTILIASKSSIATMFFT